MMPFVSDTKGFHMDVKIHLPTESERRLEALMAMTGQGVGGTISDALRLYEWALTAEVYDKDGRKIDLFAGAGS